MRKALTLLYGGTSYVIFFGTFLYLIGFLANAFVPSSVSSGLEASSTSMGAAIAIDLGLILLFGLQHSVMARPAFKARWTKIVPKSIERSTYVLMSSVVLIALFAFWRPIDVPIWELTGSVSRAVAWGVFGLGWVVILVSTFIISHFELFGLSQVFNHARGRKDRAPQFQVRFLYKFIRHPIYLGWAIAFWGTPVMTGGHLLLAAGMTAYMLVAIQLEETDLVREHGQRYENYRGKVPMLLPWKGRGWKGAPESARTEPVAG
jgi:protein-S-isoprenylcysteine O-methyltransferase Ste14